MNRLTQNRPTLQSGLVSVSLLKTAFPEGMQLRRLPEHEQTGQKKRQFVPLDNVPAWIQKQAQMSKGVDITQLSSLQDVLGATGQIVSGHTTFLVQVIVNRRERKKRSEHHVPLAKAKGILSDPTDDDYRTYLVVVPSIGVFYSDYGEVKVGGTKKHRLVPLPLEWTGWLDQHNSASCPFVKEVLDTNIIRVTYQPKDTSGGKASRLPTVPKKPVHLLAVQVDDDHRFAPILPSDVFLDGGGSGANNSNSVTGRRIHYRNLQKSSCTFRKGARHFIKGSRISPDALSDVVTLDHRILGDFDIRVELVGDDNIVHHVTWIRVRKANSDATQAVAKAGSILQVRKANARVHSKDLGKMYALGSCHDVTSDGDDLRYVFDTSNGSEETIQALNTATLPILRKDYNELLSAFRRLEMASDSNESKQGTNTTTTNNRDSFISSAMIGTIDLWNAAHVDVSDGTYSVAIWSCDDEEKEVDDGWHFVLPNVCVTNYSKLGDAAGGVGTQPTKEPGVAIDNNPLTMDVDLLRATTIKLFPGCVISWEGTRLVHCTTRSPFPPGQQINHQYACFWSIPKAQHKLNYDIETIGRDGLGRKKAKEEADAKRKREEKKKTKKQKMNKNP